ncbi:MAG: hypothetical protein BGO49_20750 [Planctomycetales bacterium 71-10]|nr:MAG: hypothetical protein BGO49_20750 [Planctomycetales bacterium 71-10]
MSLNAAPRQKFHPGQVVATPGALESLAASGQSPAEFLDRHLRGDWGDLDDEDRELNDLALLDGSRLLSAYTTARGRRIWVITEAVGDGGERSSGAVKEARQSNREGP